MEKFLLGHGPRAPKMATFFTLKLTAKAHANLMGLEDDSFPFAYVQELLLLVLGRVIQNTLWLI